MFDYDILLQSERNLKSLGFLTFQKIPFPVNSMHEVQWREWTALCAILRKQIPVKRTEDSFGSL